jgi:putative FmdB family regulatory protein
MPIREYKCPACGHFWEELRKGQTHAEECPKCGDRNILALLTSAAFVVKGAGAPFVDRHADTPSKQVVIGPGGQVVSQSEVNSDWTPPKD